MNKVITLCICIAALLASACGRQANVWYVEEGLEKSWERILGEAAPPEVFREIRAYSGGPLPPNPGVLITTNRVEPDGPLTVYYRLAYNNEYEGALALALDPWIIFYRHTLPALTYKRVFESGEGILLIAGEEPEAVEAWAARFSQNGPGAFSYERTIDREERLFSDGPFLPECEDYQWRDVLFKLLGDETAWTYAPLSLIRQYQNPRKRILAAAAFPEAEPDQYSLQARILWAVPRFPVKKQKTQALVMDWLKNPETQTAIANELGWIPAAPEAKPYDPVSMTSYLNWLTSTYVYEIEK
jgi:hypothetical protein